MKRKSLFAILTLTALTAAALLLSACSKTDENPQPPEGWEITGTDGNVDYLTAADESKVKKISLENYLENQTYAQSVDGTGNPIRLGIGELYTDYGPEYKIKLDDGQPFSVLVAPVYYLNLTNGENYRIAITVGEESMRIDLPDDFGEWAELTSDYRLQSNRALWVHIPGDYLRSTDSGTITFALELDWQDKTLQTQTVRKVDFHWDEDNLIVGSLRKSEPKDVTLLGLIFSNNVLVFLPIILLIVSIGLFIWLMLRYRFFTPRLLLPVGVLVFGAVYCRLGFLYYRSLPPEGGMFSGFSYFGQELVLYFSGIGLLAAIPILLLTFCLLRVCVQALRAKWWSRKAVRGICDK